MGWSLWPCFFASMTGLPCPGCGMTRATAALLKGQWSLAMKYHLFSPGFLVLAAFLGWAALAPRSWRDPVIRWVKGVERRTCLPLLFLVCAFIYGLIRMAVPSTNPPIVSPSPVRAWLQERFSTSSCWSNCSSTVVSVLASWDSSAVLSPTFGAG
ncbi:DUF2752 domain-containing protein [Roseimicrobium gellanilyticum]|uniref:DUF2752 domain-containing protein n=1 Tax=Roseimicrobium gellanilyticum TaxID=748857 RepID=UPI002482B943|nr:DUF2752 domain-containing protein [Roseimicrobium gellanilyticum]